MSYFLFFKLSLNPVILRCPLMVLNSEFGAIIRDNNLSLANRFSVFISMFSTLSFDKTCF